jgi:hypothetical protein
VEAFAAAAGVTLATLDGRRAIALRREPTSAPVLYGHAVRDGVGRLWLQYWTLWADNPQDRGVLHTGRHEGDWELVQVVLGPDLRPAAVTFAEHSWAVGCSAREAPVVWVAHGSHAGYPQRGEHGRPWPDPDDEAPGDGRVLRPRVTPITGQRPAWVRWPGRWGGSVAGPVPGEQSSPRGPAFQPDRRFADPAALHARARTCTSSAPAHPWPVRAGIGGVGAAGAFVLVLAAARRGRPLRFGS